MLKYSRHIPLTSYIAYFVLCTGMCFSIQALYQLYFDPDMEHKNVAQKWLTQAQASAQAWHFCWALLSPDKVCSFFPSLPHASLFCNKH